MKLNIFFLKTHLLEFIYMYLKKQKGVNTDTVCSERKQSLLKHIYTVNVSKINICFFSKTTASTYRAYVDHLNLYAYSTFVNFQPCRLQCYSLSKTLFCRCIADLFQGLLFLSIDFLSSNIQYQKFSHVITISH